MASTWIRRSVCALVLACGLLAARAQTAPSWEEEWLARFNREREAVGAPPLRLVPVLSQVAQQQADEIAAAGGRTPAAATVSEGLRRLGYAAHDWREDSLLWPAAAPVARLAANRESAPAALDRRFRDLGIGVADLADRDNLADPADRDNGGTVYVFLFGWHQGDYFAGVTAGLADRARLAAEMLARVNDVRRRAGLTPLAPNPRLDRISQQHAEDMLLRSYSGHRTPEGLDPSARARADGYRPGIGENIVEQRFSAKEALDAWMNSPGHRRNILNPDCRELGLGLAVGEGYDAAPGGYRVVWVQSFGRGG